MKLILKDIIWKCCIVYIDDILVYGRNEREHDENFQLVKQILDKYEMLENIKKRQYKVTEVEF